MCELFALSSAKDGKVSDYLMSFFLRSQYNPHGWGVGFYAHHDIVLHKEPVPAYMSYSTRQLLYEDTKSVQTLIAHIRDATVGSVSYGNTHPFSRKSGEQTWLFAHNGTIAGYRELALHRHFPEGTTDSEYIFCYILEAIEDRGIETWTEDDFNWLWKLLYRLNDRGKLNLVMSNGELLFAYFDKRGYKGLCFQPIQFTSHDDVEPVSEESERTEIAGYIIVSLPVNDVQWFPFAFGELIVFREGRVVFASHHRLETIHSFFSPAELHSSVLHIIETTPEPVSLKDILNRSPASRAQTKRAIFDLICQRKLNIANEGLHMKSWSYDHARFILSAKPGAPHSPSSVYSHPISDRNRKFSTRK